MGATDQRHGGAGLTGVVMVIITACRLSACRTAIDFAAIQDAHTAAEIKTALINDPELGSTTIEGTISCFRGQNPAERPYNGHLNSDCESRRRAPTVRKPAPPAHTRVFWRWARLHLLEYRARDQPDFMGFSS
jgi:hypothetical protein